MPFTKEQFFNVFKEYNNSVFPVQLVFLLAGIILIFLLNSKKKFITNFIKIFLIIIWIWIGLVYHLLFFTVINEAAYSFGVLFIIQGILFFIEFFIRKRFELNFENKLVSITGYSLIVFGVIIYPLIGLLLGKGIEYSILLGLPCPSLIFTFGLLILAGKNISKYLFIIPVIWAIIGFFAAINFGVYQDTALPVSAVLSLIILFVLHPKRKRGDIQSK